MYKLSSVVFQIYTDRYVHQHTDSQCALARIASAATIESEGVCLAPRRLRHERVPATNRSHYVPDPVSGYQAGIAGTRREVAGSH